MVRTYVAFTPYHLILARATQMSCGGALAHLVVADEVRICEIIPEILDIPGVHHITRLRAIESHGQALSAAIARLNARIALREVGAYSRTGDEVYIFNGRGPRPWHYTGGIEKVVVFTMWRMASMRI